MRGLRKSYEYSCLIHCVSESIPHLILQLVNNSLVFSSTTYPPGDLLTHFLARFLTYSLF